jgi:hypothetical protein
LWPKQQVVSSIFTLADKLSQVPKAINKWRESVACAGAGVPLAFLVAHHSNVDLDAISTGVLEDDETKAVKPLSFLPHVHLAANRLAEYANLVERLETIPELEPEETEEKKQEE